ncbi:MAG: LacI family transcriptional regulator [Planctomycetes bacterium]|nr:LacI family transcriptional regulator [Planctomycetota bacterium]
MGKPATIDDIAALAGVSRSTVSRVLTHNRNVKPETARRVERAMRAVNYRPNILARGLATGRLDIIALLMSETDNPFHLQILHRLEAEVRRRGFILTLCCLGQDEDSRSATLRRIREYGFAGFVMGDLKNDPQFVEAVREFDRPLVLVNRYVDSLNEFDAGVTETYRGGYLAGKHLTDLGHRRIAMLTGPLRSSASRDRYRGFADALAEAGLALDTPRLAEGDLTMAGGAAFAANLLRHGLDVSAVFAGNDSMAMGVLHHCRAAGLRVPEDLSVMGYDDLALTGSTLVDLTTVRVPYGRMAALTVERIALRIAGGEAEPERLLLPPRLVIRKTTAPA